MADTQKQKRSTDVVAPASLSIVERIFFKSNPAKPQVIMGMMSRMRLPPSVEHFNLERLIDCLKMAQAKHYRLASYIDPETMIAHPLATNAKDLVCSYRFIERKSVDTWRDVYHEEVNTNFDVGDSTRPLWRNAIVLAPENMPKSGRVLEEVRLTHSLTHSL
jgi:hypothetical protein